MPITYDGAGAVAENNAAATTLSVPYPSGITAGKVLVLVVTVGSATIATLPSGWIAGGVSSSSGGSAPSERIMVKVATGSEAGSLAVTTASATSRGIMLLFSGVDATTPVDGTGSTTASATATNTYVLPSITTTALGCALVAVGTANAPGGTWTTPATQGGTWIEVAETSGAIPSTGVQVNVWSGSGATGTVSLLRSTNVRGCSGLLALRPASTSVQHVAAGSVSASSAVSAAAAVALVAGGVVTGVSSVSGSATRVPRVHAAAGTVAASSATSAAARALLPAAGTTAGTVSTAGAAAAILRAAGAVPSSSATVGAAAGRLSSAGATPAVVTVIGSATVIGGAVQYPTAGTVAVVSASSGQVVARYSIAGSVGAISGASGSAEVPTEPSAPIRLVVGAPLAPRFTAGPRQPQPATTPAVDRYQSAPARPPRLTPGSSA